MKLVKIYSQGCKPCMMLTNYLISLGVAFEEVEINDEIIEKYDITGVPVLILLDDNDNVVDKVVGFNPSDTEKVDKLLSKFTS